MPKMVASCMIRLYAWVITLPYFLAYARSRSRQMSDMFGRKETGHGFGGGFGSARLSGCVECNEQLVAARELAGNWRRCN